ncbi:MAG TPA: heme-binding protein [Kofleriaceae bacterium]|nr:heme-binding protein [Kofleriaceae bacterium]
MFRTALLAIPFATGLGWALRSRRAGFVAGGLATFALGALRWQMARWFLPTPAYAVDGRIDALELRIYPVQVEAATELRVPIFEKALDQGFTRLASYIFGANVISEDIPMTTPVIITMHGGRYEMVFVMPPGRPVASLPQPDDPRVFLREAPERRLAVLPFRGRLTRENVSRHENRLLEVVLDAGLATRGSVGFAAYDAPATLPFLRRNEVWIEVT